MRLIPSLDLRGGHCVRLFKGDFAAETQYPVEPLALRERYAALGCELMHIVDLDGARDGARANKDVIAMLAGRPGNPALQVGGGLRTRSAVDEMLATGAARAVVGSTAVENPDEVRRWLRELGAQRVCLALDVHVDTQGEPLLVTRGWQEATRIRLWSLVETYAIDGLRHVLCTDVNRDGAMAGPNLELYREAVRRFPAIEWQASGGVRHADDLTALAATGVAAAISGKALLEGRIRDEEIATFLRNA